MATSVTISLPESLTDFVQQRVADEHFSNPSDSVRHLSAEDKRRVARERLEHLLQEGMEGPGAEIDGTDWESIRQDVHSRLRR